MKMYVHSIDRMFKKEKSHVEACFYKGCVRGTFESVVKG